MSFLGCVSVGGVPRWWYFTESTPPRKDTGVFESFGRFIIVLLDQSVTITLYICVLYIYIYSEKNIVLVFVPRVDSDK